MSLLYLLLLPTLVSPFLTFPSCPLAPAFLNLYNPVHSPYTPSRGATRRGIPPTKFTSSPSSPTSLHSSSVEESETPPSSPSSPSSPLSSSSSPSSSDEAPIKPKRKRGRPRKEEVASVLGAEGNDGEDDTASIEDLMDSPDYDYLFSKTSELPSLPREQPSNFDRLIHLNSELIRLTESMEEFVQERYESPRYVWGVKDRIHKVDPVVRGLIVVVTSKDGGREDDEGQIGKLVEGIEKTFGEVVEVERRFMGSKEDNLLEVWIESYEHTLLFSRRSATVDKKWEGGDVLDEKERGGILDSIGEHVSDGARYGYFIDDVMDE